MHIPVIIAGIILGKRAGAQLGFKTRTVLVIAPTKAPDIIAAFSLLNLFFKNSNVTPARYPSKILDINKIFSRDQIRLLENGEIWLDTQNKHHIYIE